MKKGSIDQLLVTCCGSMSPKYKKALMKSIRDMNSMCKNIFVIGPIDLCNEAESKEVSQDIKDRLTSIHETKMLYSDLVLIFAKSIVENDETDDIVVTFGKSVREEMDYCRKNFLDYKIVSYDNPKSKYYYESVLYDWIREKNEEV